MFENCSQLSTPVTRIRWEHYTHFQYFNYKSVVSSSLLLQAPTFQKRKLREPWADYLRHFNSFHTLLSTVEPGLTATPLIRSPRCYGHLILVRLLWLVGDRINGVPPYNYFGICWWIYDWVVSYMFRFYTSYSLHFMNEISNLSKSFVPKYIQMHVEFSWTVLYRIPLLVPPNYLLLVSSLTFPGSWGSAGQQ